MTLLRLLPSGAVEPVSGISHIRKGDLFRPEHWPGHGTKLWQLAKENPKPVPGAWGEDGKRIWDCRCEFVRVEQ
jgi:hypothetical protein